MLHRLILTLEISIRRSIYGVKIVIDLYGVKVVIDRIYSMYL